MNLRPEELKARAVEAGKSVENLAAAVERDGLRGPKAVSAVRNWLGGRDHPRCKRADMEKLAGAVGCEAKDIGRFVSRVTLHRGSPQKARLIVDLIRDRHYDDARNQLAFSAKRAAVNVYKALEAAADEAQQAGASFDDLYVTEVRVDGGPHIKRFRPKDRGRAHPITKRTSHITVGLEERQ